MSGLAVLEPIEHPGPFMLVRGRGLLRPMQAVGSLPLLIEDDVEIWAEVDGQMKKIRDAIHAKAEPAKLIGQGGNE